MFTEFPKRLSEKLKLIRERRELTPDEIAPLVGATNGTEIIAYEGNESDLPLRVLWAYANLAANPVRNLLEDDRELMKL